MDLSQHSKSLPTGKRIYPFPLTSNNPQTNGGQNRCRRQAHAPWDPLPLRAASTPRQCMRNASAHLLPSEASPVARCRTLLELTNLLYASHSGSPDFLIVHALGGGCCKLPKMGRGGRARRSGVPSTLSSVQLVDAMQYLQPIFKKGFNANPVFNTYTINGRVVCSRRLQIACLL